VFRRGAAGRVVISVNHPEARVLSTPLATLQIEQTEHETIVVDGGSRDGTAEIARAYRVRMLQVPSGRGAQLCAGVMRAEGNTLFFLHADSTFPVGALSCIADVLSRDTRISERDSDQAEQSIDRLNNRLARSDTPFRPAASRRGGCRENPATENSSTFKQGDIEAGRASCWSCWNGKRG